MKPMRLESDTLPTSGASVGRVEVSKVVGDRRRAKVSWSHALPLAVVLAFANGFWIISMRGAVGAIERTSDPFTAWWRESALLVPVYVVAVLVAFVLAARWFGPRPRGARALLGSGAMVALAATLAGSLLMALSSWFDFRLQRADLHHMQVTHPGCDAACTSARVQATADLLVKSIWIGLLLMLLTDLVLIALVVAFRGGVLVLARGRADMPLSGTDGTRLVLAAGLVGAAAIHAAVIPEHLDEWWAAGLFFVALSLAEVGSATALLVHGRAWRTTGLRAAVLVSAGPLVVWTVSRTVGLPFGPEAGEPEAVGVADVLSCLLELTTLVLALALLRRRRLRDAVPREWNRHAWAIALTAVLAATMIGIGGASVPVVGAFSNLGDSHAHGASSPE
jgi:hypothetical protein